MRAWAMSRGHDHRTGGITRVLHGQAAQLGADLVHRAPEVDPHRVTVEVVGGDVGQEPGRVVLESSRNTPALGDAPEGLPVGGAAHRDAHRARRAVAGEPDHRTSWQKYLPPNWGADPQAGGQRVHPRPRARGRGSRGPPRRPRGGERVEVAGGGELRRLQGVLRRVPPITMPGGRAGRPRCRALAASPRGRRQPRRVEQAFALLETGSSCWPIHRPWPMNRSS